MTLREQLIVDLERARHGFGPVGVARGDGAGGPAGHPAGHPAVRPVGRPAVRLTSPACGDEVTVELTVSGQPRLAGGVPDSSIRIHELRWTGHGCTVSLASASALAAVFAGADAVPSGIEAGPAGLDAVPAGIDAVSAGIDAVEFVTLKARFELLVRGEDVVADFDALDALSAATGLGAAVAFAGIGRLPLRADCALLAWRAVAQALTEYPSGGS